MEVLNDHRHQIEVLFTAIVGLLANFSNALLVVVLILDDKDTGVNDSNVGIINHPLNFKFTTY